MGIRFGLAKATGAILTWGLRGVFRRPAANTPGKIALYVDPALLAHLAPRMGSGSVLVVGTNGKTTVTNLLADVLERSGNRVVCNRTGANLDSGVASMLLQSKGADWGVFETDELWLAKILPHLKSRYVVLLNLFRDQLDRVGEVDRIQDSIVGALGKSPDTVLVYNADDPLCARIADCAAQLPGREGTRSIAFGVAESMGLPQNDTGDAQMCQRCGAMFEYAFRQYSQLGAYRCLSCGFARPALDFAAVDVRLGMRDMAFGLAEAGGTDGQASSLHAPFNGAYMVYNLTAVVAAARLTGCPAACVQEAIDAFDPQNGRLQEYRIGGRRVLLNLAKNPTGFNQNLAIIAKDDRPKAVAFFVNDKEGDGRDVSWIWDVDFESLAEQAGCAVFAGGIRRNDLQVRLKYADVTAPLVEGIEEVLAALPDVDGLPADASVYAIANYTALPPVHADLDRLAQQDPAVQGRVEAAAAAAAEGGVAAAEEPGRAGQDAVPAELAPDGGVSDEGEPLVIVQLFPDLLNLYGDGGNVRILERRCAWRGVPVELRRVLSGEAVSLEDADLVFLGGGPDREQRLAFGQLAGERDALARFVADGGVVLAICGGFQVLGNTWLLGDEELPGLGLVNMETRRPGGAAGRILGDIALCSPLATRPVIGYENHAGRTFLGADVECFGEVVASVGTGNSEEAKCDGAMAGGVFGSYLHGPLLAKNPEVADRLLEAALAHRRVRLAASSASCGAEPAALPSLDDVEEIAANAYMCKRLGVTA